METHRLLIVVLLYMGMPTSLSYIGFKAASMVIDSETLQPDITLALFIASMTWAVSIFVIWVFLHNFFENYLKYD